MSNVVTYRRDLIAALLGPAGPELSCEECFEQLDGYVELQLAAVDADRVVPGMRAHLAGCSACREGSREPPELAGTEGRQRRP